MLKRDKNIHVILQKDKAFVSSFVLILFVSFISAGIAYINMINNNLKVLDNLRKIEADILEETKVLYAFECMLKDGCELLDYYIDNNLVRIYQDNEAYVLDYKDISLKVEVKDQDIVRYSYINWHKS